jgi:hypothetical protein
MAKDTKSVEQPKADTIITNKTMGEVVTDLAVGTAAVLTRAAIETVAASLGARRLKPAAPTKKVKAKMAKPAPKKAARKSKAKSAKKSSKKAAKKSTKKATKKSEKAVEKSTKKTASEKGKNSSGKKASRKARRP